MGFTHVQGNRAEEASGGSGSSVSVVLASAPTQGNLVCVGINWLTVSTLTSIAVKDSNNNVYTVTPSSPTAFLTGPGGSALAYLLSAPANATATITATWASLNPACIIFADEF